MPPFAMSWALGASAMLYLSSTGKGARSDGSSAARRGNGEQIAVFNIDGEFLAIENMCTHEEASLAEGDVSGHA